MLPIIDLDDHVVWAHIYADHYEVWKLVDVLKAISQGSISMRRAW